MRLSVIVPMYNVEKYLPQCLESLRDQTFKDMEVLLVDDGSTDSTAEIAKEFAAQNRNFRYFYKENGGLSSARNHAIPYVKGEYVTFLDSDDWVEPALYEKMMGAIGEADVCVTDIEYYYEEPEKRFIMKGLTDWEADSIQKRALLSPLFAWNKIYRSALFQNGGYRYPEGTWYEDHPVTTMIFAKANDIAYLPECLIHYRQREGSIMAATSDRRIGQIFDVLQMVRENFQKEGIYEQYRDELEYLHIEHLRLYGMFRFIRSDDWETYYRHSEEVVHQYFPHWKSNRYISNLSLKNRIFLRFYNRFTAPVFNRMIRN